MQAPATRISIIIPIYNMEAYLAQTLESVAALSYPNLEVVLVDDGSTDNSASIAQQYATQHAHVHFFQQANQGVAVARNIAIAQASGCYIFPLDGDDLLHEGFLQEAATILDQRAEVKVVCGSDQFFDQKQGPWRLPPFDIKLLARKNILNASALYRKADYLQTIGYDSTLPWNEDWGFWISLLKTGGEVVRLTRPAISYRIRSHSRRSAHRSKKQEMIRLLNQRDPEFFLEHLGGPLRQHRSLSTCINRVARLFSGKKIHVHPDYAHLSAFVYHLPTRFKTDGEYIYKGRNQLKRFDIQGCKVIVKSYRLPIFINRLIYGLLRPSKAERSYDYALRFLAAGIGTPHPVGFIAERQHGLMGQSYFVCLESSCNYLYKDFAQHTFQHQEAILEAIGRTTAQMHEAQFLHKDYSAGNILFRDELPVPIEIIDLNRMRFHKISQREGCKNFERLPGTPQMFAQMGAAYAKTRKMDVKQCISLIEEFHD